jgi:hypothetical protein
MGCVSDKECIECNNNLFISLLHRDLKENCRCLEYAHILNYSDPFSDCYICDSTCKNCFGPSKIECSSCFSDIESSYNIFYNDSCI